MKKMSKKQAVVDPKYCVACGVCMRNCPVKAITIPRGIQAEINLDKCVGCSKCSKICPASTIYMREVMASEK